MPAFALPCFGFALGALFAWLARAELSRRHSALESRALLITWLFSALVYAPVYSYLLTTAQAWSFGYWLAPSGANRVAALLGVLVTISPPFGFLIVAPRARQNHVAYVFRVAGSALGLGLLLLAIGIKRLSVSSTYVQYQGGFAKESLFGSALGYGILWLACIVVFGVLWTARAVNKLSSVSD